MMYFKVNDRQYMQISPGLNDQSQDRLIHIGFETADASGCATTWPGREWKCRRR